MGKRARKQKTQNEPGSSGAINKQWTVEDKRNLLNALRKYGHKDIANISAMLGNRTPSAVRLIINKIMQKSRSENPNECTTLETWLDSVMFKDKRLPIPQALKFISMFENHPSPEESNGFDFRAAYDHLYRVTLGYPGIDLSEQTAAKLEELMAEVHREVWPAEEDHIVAYLGMLERKKHALKCYPPMSKLESRKIIVPDQD